MLVTKLRVVLVTMILIALTTTAGAGGKVDWSEYVDKQRPPVNAPAQSTVAAPEKAPTKAAKPSKAKTKAKAKAKARSKKKARR